MITLEVQHTNSCSLVDKMILNTKQAIKELGFHVKYKETIINDNLSDMNFRGCPTLLVNGRDYEGKLKRKDDRHICRNYPNGIPTVSQIKQFIKLNY